ncbi:MAG TPA: YkvA family protein [Candidatus Limnocylindrales bacterium]
MASNMRRAAAFTALWRALVSHREGPSIGTRLGAVPRMVWQSLKGRYDGGARIMLMLGGAFYLVSPIDLIPDFLIIPGLIDDVLIITWVAGAFLSETERFLKWEDSRIPRVVIDGDMA